MDKKPILKIIDVQQSLLDARDVAGVVGFSVDAEEDPETVRMFQGSIGFRFPRQEERGRELWDDPGIRGWGGAVYDHVPHLLYYLDPEPALGAIALALVTSGPGLDDQLRSLSDRLASAAVFAEKMADPWEPIVDRLLDPLEPGLAGETRNIVAASVALTFAT